MSSKKYNVDVQAEYNVAFSDMEKIENNILDNDSDWACHFFQFCDIEALVEHLVIIFKKTSSSYEHGIGIVYPVEGFGNFIQSECGTKFVSTEDEFGSITIEVVQEDDCQFVQEVD